MSIVTIKEIGGDNIHLEKITVTGSLVQERLIEHTFTMGVNYFPGYADYAPATVNDTLIEIIDRKADISQALPIGGTANDFLAGDKTWKPVTKNTVGLDQLTNHTQLRLEDLDTDITLSANSNSKIPSQKAVKTFVDTHSWDAGIF